MDPRKETAGEAIRRMVDPQTAMFVSHLVNCGELTEEAAYRLMFPEEAAKLYDLTRWPYGPPAL